MPETATPAPADPVAAYLAGVHERWDTAENAAYSTLLGRAQGLVSLADIPRLLAAVEEALKLPARWEAFGDGQDAQSECAAELREAVARELLAKEDNHG